MARRGQQSPGALSGARLLQGTGWCEGLSETLNLWVDGCQKKDIWWQQVWEHWGKRKLLKRSNFYSVLLFKAHPLVYPGSQHCLQGWEGLVLPEELLGSTGKKHWWENDRSRGWWWAGVSRMVLGEWMGGTADCCWTQVPAFWPCSQQCLQGLWEPHSGPPPAGRSCQGVRWLCEDVWRWFQKTKYTDLCACFLWASLIHQGLIEGGKIRWELICPRNEESRIPPEFYPVFTNLLLYHSPH